MKTQFNPPQLSDFELDLIFTEINWCYYRIEQLTEILIKAGVTKGYSDIEKPPQTALNAPNKTTSDSLPWISYTTRQIASSGEAAWIFSNNKGVETLLATLKNNDGKTTIGAFEYTLQGDAKQFISRKPVK